MKHDTAPGNCAASYGNESLTHSFIRVTESSMYPDSVPYMKCAKCGETRLLGGDTDPGTNRAR